MRNNIERILESIPHKSPYRFVDDILEVSEDHIIGTYFLHPSSDFYIGHFPGSKLTPGFIIAEIMAQIGILGLGIYLVDEKINEVAHAFLATSEIKFHGVSYSNDTILIDSRKVYFRFGKLKCSIKAFNQKGELICSGSFSGIIKTQTNVQ